MAKGMYSVYAKKQKHNDTKSVIPSSLQKRNNNSSIVSLTDRVVRSPNLPSSPVNRFAVLQVSIQLAAIRSDYQKNRSPMHAIFVEIENLRFEEARKILYEIVIDGTGGSVLFERVHGMQIIQLVLSKLEFTESPLLAHSTLADNKQPKQQQHLSKPDIMAGCRLIHDLRHYNAPHFSSIPKSTTLECNLWEYVYLEALEYVCDVARNKYPIKISTGKCVLRCYLEFVHNLTFSYFHTVRLRTKQDIFSNNVRCVKYMLVEAARKGWIKSDGIEPFAGIGSASCLSSKCDTFKDSPNPDSPLGKSYNDTTQSSDEEEDEKKQFQERILYLSEPETPVIRDMHDEVLEYYSKTLRLPNYHRRFLQLVQLGNFPHRMSSMAEDD